MGKTPSKPLSPRITKEPELSDIRNQLALITARVSIHKDKRRPPLDFPVDSYGSWPQNL